VGWLRGYDIIFVCVLDITFVPSVRRKFILTTSMTPSITITLSMPPVETRSSPSESLEGVRRII
jgi:hypothetical protein